MNFLDMMGPQKRKMIELMQQQQMMQGLTPEILQQMQSMGVTPYAQPNMPQAGQPGYGILAPTATPEAMAQGQAAASGAPTMAQSVPGLLAFAANMAGGAEEQAPAPQAPPQTRPIGTSKEGLSSGARREAQEIKRRKKYRS
jgi:hypothetical protein